MPRVRVEGGLSLLGSRSLRLGGRGKAAWRRGRVCGLGLKAAQYLCGQTLGASAREGCAGEVKEGFSEEAPLRCDLNGTNQLCENIKEEHRREREQPGRRS